MVRGHSFHDSGIIVTEIIITDSRFSSLHCSFQHSYTEVNTSKLNTWIIVFQVAAGTNSDLKVAHCNDVACTNATLTYLDTTGSVGYNTSVTIGSDGLGLISYYDYTNKDLKVAHCANKLCVPFFRRR